MFILSEYLTFFWAIFMSGDVIQSRRRHGKRAGAYLKYRKPMFKNLHALLDIANFTNHFWSVDFSNLIQHSRPCTSLWIHQAPPKPICNRFLDPEGISNSPSIRASHLWMLVLLHPGDITPKFYVDVLKSVCKLALKKGVRFVCVDGQCIYSRSRETREDLWLWRR